MFKETRLFGPMAYLCVCVNGAMFTPLAFADSTELEKVKITADPLGRTVEAASQPVEVLSEADIRHNQSAAIGELLSTSPGVHNGSFGAAVGRPVIRGLGGARVKVMQNGIDSLDAGQISPDHAVAVDSQHAHQIEILRGPAALIYGSDAVGGAVNVVDNRIPIAIDESQTELGLEAASGNEGKALTFENIHMFDNLRTHISLSSRSADSYNIPHAHSEEEETEEHHNEETLENSDLEQRNASAGFAYSFDRLTVGLALSYMDHEFGLPGHGHHEEEGAVEEDEEEAARVDLEQTRVDGQAVYTFLGNDNAQQFSLLDMTAKFAWVDYEHSEGHEEAGHDAAPSDHDHGGLTTFTRKAFESRVHVNYKMLGDQEGVFGFQLNQSDFSAQGAEAVVPTTELTQVGLFALHSMPVSSNLTFDVAARVENNAHDVATNELDATHLTECGLSISDFESQSFSNGSISAGLNHRSNNVQVKTNFTRVSRSPAIQELYSCGAHESSLTFEIGNPDLKNEESLGLDFAVQVDADDWQFSGSVFANKINHFIYQQALGIEIDELDAQAYEQQDATLQGYEVSISYQPIERLSVTVFSDQTVAKFNSGAISGQYVPRIPAQRAGMEVSYLQGLWSAKIRNTHYMRQDRLAFGETETEGFDLVSIGAEYIVPSRNGELTLYTSMQNLLDEEVRYHTSFVKDEVLQPGRNVRVGMKYAF